MLTACLLNKKKNHTSIDDIPHPLNKLFEKSVEIDFFFFFFVVVVIFLLFPPPPPPLLVWVRGRRKYVYKTNKVLEPFLHHCNLYYLIRAIEHQVNIKGLSNFLYWITKKFDETYIAVFL